MIQCIACKEEERKVLDAPAGTLDGETVGMSRKEIDVGRRKGAAKALEAQKQSRRRNYRCSKDKKGI